MSTADFFVAPHAKGRVALCDIAAWSARIASTWGPIRPARYHAAIEPDGSFTIDVAAFEAAKAA